MLFSFFQRFQTWTSDFPPTHCYHLLLVSVLLCTIHWLVCSFFANRKTVLKHSNNPFLSFQRVLFHVIVTFLFNQLKFNYCSAFVTQFNWPEISHWHLARNTSYFSMMLDYNFKSFLHLPTFRDSNCIISLGTGTVNRYFDSVHFFCTFSVFIQKFSVALKK